MDVGFYLGELLMQQGEVSVPGLGYFVQVRMSGHYNENERKFYPPYHQVQFDLQSIDDDALAEYIAVKKNISVASAKYFAEKYITDLKQQALIAEVPIGNLGVFYTEITQLTFKPAQKIIDDTIFYGFEPININKIGDIKPVAERFDVESNYATKQALLKPTVTPEVQEIMQPVDAVPQTARVYHEEKEIAAVSSEFFETAEEEEKKSPLILLLIIFISVVVVALSVYALHEYKPDTFAKIAFWKPKTIVADIVKPKPVVVSKPDTIATDSLKADSLKKDSIAAAVKKDTVATTAVTATTKKTKVVTTQSVALPKKKEVIISQTEVPAPKRQVIIEQLPPKKKDMVLSQTVTSQPVAALNKPAITKPKATPVNKPLTAMDKLETNGKIQAVPSDAVGTRRFEVYAVTTESIAEANAAIKKLKKAGLDPRWVTDASGTLYHISIGHFATKPEAIDFAFKNIEAGKVPGGNAYGIEIIPNK